MTTIELGSLATVLGGEASELSPNASAKENMQTLGSGTRCVALTWGAGVTAKVPLVPGWIDKRAKTCWDGLRTRLPA